MVQGSCLEHRHRGEEFMKVTQYLLADDRRLLPSVPVFRVPHNRKKNVLYCRCQLKSWGDGYSIVIGLTDMLENFGV